LDHSNEFDVRKGAIQLDASNFLDSNLLKEGKVNLTEISRDYLRTNHFPNKNFRDKIIRNRKKLQDLKQEMEVKNITDKYNPKSISFLNDEKYLLSGWYLIKAMEESKSGNFEKAFMLSDIAKQISPNYFEPYKISGYLYFLKKDNRAENEFKTALQLAKNDVDKAAVLLLYSTFALYRDDRHKALRLIKEALEHDGDNYDIVLEKVKILTYLGKYNEAQSILKDISTDDLVTLKLKNIYYTRYAETFRRRAERIEKRFFDGRYPLLVEAFNCLEKSPKPDYKLTNKKIDILIDIFYYYHDENAIKFFLSKVKKHYTELYQNNRFSKLYSIVRSKMSSIPYEYYIPELTTYFQDYDLKSVTIKQKNIGIITTLKEKFGFLKNSKYTNGLYFRILNNDKYYLGDLVQFKLMKNKNRSDYAKIIEVKESSFDDIR
jgi:tetratricopeptide (TPR) repeat protein